MSTQSDPQPPAIPDGVDPQRCHLIGRRSDFGEEVSVIVVGTRRVAVAGFDGRLTACLARCPHGAYVMEAHEIHGPLLTCALHGWRFDMRRGGCEIHGYESLPPLAVHVVDDSVFIEFDR